MSRHSSSKWRRAAAGVAAALLCGLAMASLLTLAETDTWWVRWFDFPRLQFAIGLLILLPVFLALRPGRSAALVLGAAALAALGYNAYKLHPYFDATAEPMAAAVADCEGNVRLRVMVANVQERNEQAEMFRDLVGETAPDVLLVLETDAWWDKQLEPLRSRFVHEVEDVPAESGAFGMHLFSRLPLLDPEVRFLFGGFTPSIFTGIALPNGAEVRFLGLHPRPPHWSQPSTMRDAHLLAAALEARETEAPAILAGDFNAVPWERVSRRAMRIANLLDPRVGRGLYPTFSANSTLMSWPLDQVLYQDRLVLLSFEVLPAIGSDHYPVLATLCHRPGARDIQSAPDATGHELEEAAATIKEAKEMATASADS